MNCTMCNFNTSNSPVSVCCKLDYPENCEKEIARNLNGKISVEEWFQLGKVIIEREGQKDE